MSLLNDGWVCTDPSCDQYRKIVPGFPKRFVFKEDRTTDPISGKVEVYESGIDLDDYSINEMVDNCKPFGYSKEMVEEWLKGGSFEFLALIAECIFEMEV